MRYAARSKVSNRARNPSKAVVPTLAGPGSERSLIKTRQRNISRKLAMRLLRRINVRWLNILSYGPPVDIVLVIEAAKAHERAAELHQECDSPTFAGQQFLQAAFCYRKKEERGDDMQGGDMQSAARCYQKASQIFARAGNWPSAAKAQNDLGLLIEIEFEDYKAAVEAFERAAEWYAMGRQPA